jgi:hypothetical protein
VDTLEGHRPDACTPAADIETISLQKIVNPWNAMLCEAAGGTTSASSAFPRSVRVYPAMALHIRFYTTAALEKGGWERAKCSSNNSTS